MRTSFLVLAVLALVAISAAKPDTPPSISDTRRKLGRVLQKTPEYRSGSKSRSRLN